MAMLFDLDRANVRQLAQIWKNKKKGKDEIGAGTTSPETGAVIESSPASSPASSSSSFPSSSSSSSSTNSDHHPAPGDAVRIRLDIDRPVNGWGNVQKAEVGRVVMADGDTIIVDFPSENGAPWMGRRSDIQVMPRDKPTQSESSTSSKGATADGVVVGARADSSSSSCCCKGFVAAPNECLPQAGDWICMKGEEGRQEGMGEVLVVEGGCNRITAIFDCDGGAPRIVMADQVDVMVPVSTAATSNGILSPEASFLADMRKLSGGKVSSSSSPSLFGGSTVLDEMSPAGVDPVTRAALLSIMEEDRAYQEKRRREAQVASNAEIANSTEFGFVSDLLKLTKSKLGPKIRLRRKIQFPKEWTLDLVGGSKLEILNLFACALADKNHMASYGLKNLKDGSSAAASVASAVSTSDSGGETKGSELDFKSGDMLCVHPSSSPWWGVENVKIEDILSRSEEEMLRAGLSSSTSISTSSTVTSAPGDGPQINRNFVQPLVSFFRLRFANGSNEEFGRVSAIFLSRMGKSASKVEITAIDRIQNADLWEDYHVRHARVDKETRGNSDVRILQYGCPNLTMVLGIATQGFDWRIHAANGGTPHKQLGQGFYFQEKGHLAHAEAKRDVRGRHHMILARVCVGRSIKGNPTVRKPPPGFHSAHGDHGQVVVFDFCQAYPLYTIEYTHK